MPTDRTQADLLRDYFDGSLPPDQRADAERLLERDPDALTLLDDSNQLETFVSHVREALAMPNFPDERNDELAQKVRDAVLQEVQSPAAETASIQLGDPAVSTDSQTPADETISLAFLSPPQAAGEIGRLNGYRILRELGHGGMGLVFEAEDVRLKRRVALKVMKPGVAARETSRQRFLREAQAAAQVEHDHICPIYQVGEDNGVPFIAMPFLKGEPLDVLLKRQRVTIAEAVRITRQVALGLAAAHAQNLIHRDIKPANIWLESPTGRVKILDFGLARSIAENTNLTASGAVMGTPAYMAPEQARGRPVDARADLFSLGCMLYELTTGRRAFTGPDTMAILTSLALDWPTAPRQVNPDCPLALSQLTLELLHKNPSRRPASAEAVAHRLGQLELPTVEVVDQTVVTPANDPWSRIEDDEATLPVATPAQPLATKRRRRQLPFAAAAVAVVLLGLGIVFSGTIVRVVNNEGELVVTVDDPNTEVVVKDGGVEIRREENGRKRIFLVKAGKDGEVEVREPGSETVLVMERFKVARAGMVEVVVMNEKLAAARKPKERLGSNAIDREVAEWVFSIGGSVVFDDAGQLRQINAARDIPAGQWSLQAVILADNRKVTKTGLTELAKLHGLCGITLNNSDVTDEDIKTLSNAKTLNWLRLDGTRIGDTALTHLKKNETLAQLDVRKTTVTAMGLAEFHTALPQCRIEWDGGVIEPQASHSPAALTAEQRKALEWVLTVGGTLRVEIDGKERDVTPRDELPKMPLAVKEVLLSSTKAVDDTTIERLKELPAVGHCLNLGNTSVTAIGLSKIANYPGLTGIRRLELVGAPITDVGLKSVNQFARLQMLRLDVTQVTDAGLEHLTTMPELYSLDLSSNSERITDKGLDYLAKCKQLNSVSLSKTSVTEAGIKRLAAALPNCRIDWNGGVLEPQVSADADRRAAQYVLSIGGKVRVLGNNREITAAVDLPIQPIQLTIVDLQSSQQITDDAMALFKDCSNLANLYLFTTSIGDAGLAHLKNCDSLSVLHLGKTKISDSGLSQLTQFKNLVELDLLGTSVSNAGMAHLKQCKNLTTLNIFGTHINDEGLALLKDVKNLTNLYAGGNSLTDSGLVELKNFAKLTGLALDDTKVGDAGMAHIQECKNLAYLDLCGTQLSDAAVTLLKDCKRLTHLALLRTKVTEAGIAELRKSLPQCKIEWDGGIVAPKK